VNVQVNKTRGDDQAARVEFLFGNSANPAGWSHLGDLAVAQQDVHQPIDLRCGVDEAAAFDQHAAIFFSIHE
jgi:hypothetical protein